MSAYQEAAKVADYWKDWCQKQIDNGDGQYESENRHAKATAHLIADQIRNLTPPAPDATLTKEAFDLLNYLWGRAKFHDISIATETEADLERVMSALRSQDADVRGDG